MLVLEVHSQVHKDKVDTVLDFVEDILQHNVDKLVFVDRVVVEQAMEEVAALIAVAEQVIAAVEIVVVVVAAAVV